MLDMPEQTWNRPKAPSSALQLCVYYKRSLCCCIDTGQWTSPPGANLGPREGYSHGCRAVRSWRMRDCLRPLKLELHGPRRGLNIGPRSSGG
eukprot:7647452-Alexandrium_andersonii.AAC.1